MSESAGASPGWRLYVLDMISFCERVLLYTNQLDRAAFTSDTRTFDATLRNLELIGEAATRIHVNVR